jgi:hypothetical protein
MAMRKVLAAIIFAVFAVPLFAQSTEPVTGYCNLGGANAAVSGLLSTNFQQGMIPGCQVSVYLHGTQTLASPIYADSNNTPLNNPFTANVQSSPNSGGWIFWAPVSTCYDVVGNGGVSPNNYPSPVTLTEVCLEAGGGGGGGICAGLGSTAGDLCIFNGTAWYDFGGNEASQKFLAETNGIPSWSASAAQVSCENIPGLQSCNAPYPLTTNDVKYTLYPQNTSLQLMGPPPGAGSEPYLANPIVCQDLHEDYSTATCTTAYMRAGDILPVAMIAPQESSIGTPTDTAGDAWHGLYAVGNTLMGYFVASTGGFQTVSVPLGANSNFMLEVGEAIGASAVDAVSGLVQGCSGSNVAFDSITTTASDAILSMIVGGSVGGLGYSTYTAGSPFIFGPGSQLSFYGGPGVNPSMSVGMMFGPFPTPGTYTPTATATGLCFTATLSVAFKNPGNNAPEQPIFRDAWLSDLVTQGWMPPPVTGEFLSYTGTYPNGNLTWSASGACPTCLLASSPTQYGIMYGAGTQTLSATTPPTVNGFYFDSYNVTGSAAVAPAALLSTSLPAGTAIGSLDTGTPTITFGTNLITLSKPLMATSLLATGIIDGTAPITLTTGASCTIGTASGCNATKYLSGYTINQDTTSSGAAAITYTLPTAAAGLQYCVNNGYDGTEMTTGTLTLQTSAAGQYIIYGALSASDGYIVSGGAAGVSGCVVGIDATHWQFYAQAGTWTLH